MLVISWKFPYLKPRRNENNTVIDSFLSMQHSKIADISVKFHRDPAESKKKEEERRQTAAFPQTSHQTPLYSESIDVPSR
jgi:hypothetical protein